MVILGHEMGIMFGFIGKSSAFPSPLPPSLLLPPPLSRAHILTLIVLMLISMALYGVAWQIGNKRSTRIEIERVEALRASGWLDEKRMGGEEVEKVEKEENAGKAEKGDGVVEPTEIKL